MPSYSIGLDFGTESVRALVVDTADGRVAGQAVVSYAHGVIDRALPNDDSPLPPDYALQHPLDWLEGVGKACRAAVEQADVSPADVIGVGVDFTSCTMLPTRADGTPLCLLEHFARGPLAWPKLWKHHGAKSQTDRVNHIARDRNEPWLNRYGGAIGLEWFWPKVLETAEHDREAYDAADVWLEAGDWLVWQLTDGPFPHCRADHLVRSTCQAGYKATWSAKDGYPSPDFFAAVHPALSNALSKMPGRHLAPGQRAGGLTDRAAALLGLAPGTPVSAAIIDAHAGVPGSGVADAGTLVLVLGTSACHMLNATADRYVPGVAGVVDGGILPGFFGYETGQASVGDAFAWVTRTTGLSHAELTAKAETLPAGSGGVIALDWLNGARTPLMDGRLSGALVGLTLNTRPEQIYRAMLEATAFGLQWIADTLRDAGVAVDRYVASGGLPDKSPLLMQICADVLGAEIRLAASDQSVALGAAILGRIAAGHGTIAQAIHDMARLRAAPVYRPGPNRARYELLYPMFRELAAGDGALANIMRRLREV